MDYVIWLKPKTYILSKYNLYNVLSFVDLIWCVGLFCSYFLFLQSTCNHCHSLIRFLNAQSLLYRIEILNKINTLFWKWIKDISRQKVNFVFKFAVKICVIFLFTSTRLYMHTKTEGICIWKLSAYCSFMEDFIEYWQHYKNI